MSLRLRGHGLVERLHIRDLSPQALLLGDSTHRSISSAIDQVARARALVIATPVYKAAYSGVLKVFLDLLPQAALRGKVVLPLATGGSPNHMLALDYALRPVLQSLAARHILTGIYATDAQVTLTPEGAYVIGAEVGDRLAEGAATLLHEVLHGASVATAFRSIAFADVRCSV